MPMYDFKCEKCGTTFEEYSQWDKQEEVRCKCGAQPKRLYTMRNGFDHFTPYFLENVGDGHKPVWINSRSERKRVFKEYNIEQKPASNEFIKRKGRMYFDMSTRK
jgi:putative FmdB family regulatory protein